MDRIGLAIKLLRFLIVAGVVGAWLWSFKRVRGTAGWPLTEGTIESAAPEIVTTYGRPNVRLPTFAFSYKVAGEYYSGRFSLMPYITDPDDGLTSRMIGRKLAVKYDPRRPEVWFIPEKLIEGCKVEQKMSHSLIGLQPRD